MTVHTQIQDAASFASEHVVISRVLNAKKCSSFIVNGFQKFTISKLKFPAITVRFLAVVRAGGRKESAIWKLSALCTKCRIQEMARKVAE